MKLRYFGIFVIVVALSIGLYFRCYNILHGQSVHPDERHIVMTTGELADNNMNPRSFAYGSFPFYVIWGVSKIAGFFKQGLDSYDGIYLVGRYFIACCYLLLSYLVFLLARKITKSDFSAILAVVLLSLNVLSIQLYRFITVDPFLAIACLVTLLAVVNCANNYSRRNLILIGLALGFAFAVKATALSLLAPVFLLLIIKNYKNWRTEKLAMLKSNFIDGTTIALTVLFTLFVFCPYYFLDYSTFYSGVMEQISMVTGQSRPPYVIQYENTAPYFYHLEQIWNYTMGQPLALIVLGGFIFECLRIKRMTLARALILFWVICFVIATAGQQVKFVRYLLPMYPVLFIYAADFLRIASENPKYKLIGWSLITVVISFMLFYATAFNQIYRVPHTYDSGSEWIYENIPAGAKITGVHWDDKLPVTLPGKSSDRYEMEGSKRELPFYEKDNENKLHLMAEGLSSSDYIVFPSPRIPGSITRLPDEYNLSNEILTALYNGALGFELVKTIKVRPQIGGVIFNDDLADESFYVYDHPKVTVFKNKAHYTTEFIESFVTREAQKNEFMSRNEILLMDR